MTAPVADPISNIIVALTGLITAFAGLVAAVTALVRALRTRTRPPNNPNGGQRR